MQPVLAPMIGFQKRLVDEFIHSIFGCPDSKHRLNRTHGCRSAEDRYTFQQFLLIPSQPIKQHSCLFDHIPLASLVSAEVMERIGYTEFFNYPYKKFEG